MECHTPLRFSGQERQLVSASGLVMVNLTSFSAWHIWKFQTQGGVMRVFPRNSHFGLKKIYIWSAFLTTDQRYNSHSFTSHLLGLLQSCCRQTFALRSLEKIPAFLVGTGRDPWNPSTLQDKCQLWGLKHKWFHPLGVGSTLMKSWWTSWRFHCLPKQVEVRVHFELRVWCPKWRGS